MHNGGSSRTEAARAAIVMGATGTVGHFLLPRLSAAGWEVHALSRRAAPAGSPGSVRWHAHDITRGLGGLDLRGAAVVFHAAPLWLLPPLLAELRSRGVARLLAFGSTSRFTKQGSRAPASRRMAEALAAAEDAVQAECGRLEIACTVFRPTLIYGAGLDRNVTTVARVARRWGVFPLAGQGRGLRQPVHADDLALACLQAVDEPRTFGRAYDLTGGSTLTYREMVEQVFAAVGRRPRVLSLPVPVLRAALRVARRVPLLRGVPADAADRMDVDQAFDCSDARRDFGYAPRPFDAAASVVAGFDGAH
jgi:nucleoside-diphosphate-sugar epimerase